MPYGVISRQCAMKANFPSFGAPALERIGTPSSGRKVEYLPVTSGAAAITARSSSSLELVTSSF